MKKIFLTATVLFTFLLAGFAQQKIAYVDTDYILNNIPAYKTAQDELDKMSEQWQKEIEDLYQQIDQMYKDYQVNQVLLSEDMKMKREDEIVQKEKDIKELQKKYFGQEGDLYQKRKELVEPIQASVNDALKQVANDGNYDFVFDVASAGATMLFSNPKFDISNQVLTKMGYTPKD